MGRVIVGQQTLLTRAETLLISTCMTNDERCGEEKNDGKDIEMMAECWLACYQLNKFGYPNMLLSVVS